MSFLFSLLKMLVNSMIIIKSSVFCIYVLPTTIENKNNASM